jgi:metallophosphoesterase (TIGR00282 family)
VNLLFIGDIFASPGRHIVRDHLADIVTSNNIHLAVANVENSAGGFGVTPAIAQELFGYGLDVLTSGNHIWDKKEVYDYLAKEPKLLRPANYPSEVPGRGVTIIPARNGSECAIINLQGRTYMPSTDCPFRKADDILASLEHVKIRFVDFHAEVTSEKMAMGWHLNGRV